MMQALRFRLYHLINRQDFIEVSENRCGVRMLNAASRRRASGRGCRITL